MVPTIRAAAEADAEAICVAVRRSIAECCSADHRNDPLLVEAWLANKTPSHFREWLSSSHYGVVAENDRGEVVGFALMLASGEIALCYLVPEARFKGAGRAMLSALERKAREQGIPSLRLDSTQTARQFYLRNGFAEDGEAVVGRIGTQVFPMRKVLQSQVG